MKHRREHPFTSHHTVKTQVMGKSHDSFIHRQNILNDKRTHIYQTQNNLSSPRNIEPAFSTVAFIQLFWFLRGHLLSAHMLSLTSKTPFCILQVTVKIKSLKKSSGSSHRKNCSWYYAVWRPLQQPRTSSMLQFILYFRYFDVS